MTQLKPLIAANWKMNGDKALIAEFSTAFTTDKVNGIDIIVCPPSIYLDEFSSQVASNNSAIAVGAQNLSDKESGAFTGEISAAMLQQVNCNFAIVGHSERRSLFGETPQFVASKYATALANNITPILCTGESEQQREDEQTFTVIAQDIDAVIERSGIESFKDGIIAYEPVWAIGTGKSATPEQAQDVHAFIRKHLAKHDEEVAAGVRILYGGSVNENNAAELFKQKDINGALVGGASLVVDKFMAICQNA
ncbi:triose-phosphate isomerase [Psychrobium sp. 1_MG-2023]|uniref:triose-phosphate isomerase n=1 Tax=Psychrobium sp. 1_MG-2023 TaxID=3062624 RepID=UPI000C32088E|nr:triose-phosphate isomerase [Psychrobium sp. 1_MG-2023]MDP2562677.1 triose-phosphate isomerase [Psychrobium sp. 1_MG-2023]PKF54809.1 triose-phosphate isomerase [Alteromonadales bacterium alter-6D02]